MPPGRAERRTVTSARPQFTLTSTSMMVSHSSTNFHERESSVRQRMIASVGMSTTRSGRQRTASTSCARSGGLPRSSWMRFSVGSLIITRSSECRGHAAFHEAPDRPGSSRTCAQAPSGRSCPDRRILDHRAGETRCSTARKPKAARSVDSLPPPTCRVNDELPDGRGPPCPHDCLFTLLGSVSPAWHRCCSRTHGIAFPGQGGTNLRPAPNPLGGHDDVPAAGSHPDRG